MEGKEDTRKDRKRSELLNLYIPSTAQGRLRTIHTRRDSIPVYKMIHYVQHILSRTCTDLRKISHVFVPQEGKKDRRKRKEKRSELLNLNVPSTEQGHLRTNHTRSHSIAGQKASHQNTSHQNTSKS